ncbi:hypothetical protein ONS95_011717 [Cadophora gregata]|uniref:uncharacterized protein n=1 Tax=Cadophora gregata TaxID=51156 RepID=UPI0026DCFAD9|nr:uncharacterized protein ONS95_011717 [Cadophora gregata]KAK0120311.1 hypothetical protein ONS95_011717 [Cadophora gregata]KAK0121344.1 hypothetical protein ONS96_011519 [Cadophora gregata f. sp. sojae]
MATTSNSTPPTLPTLPSELLLHILSFLDIPDLLTLTRTSHPLRSLSLDPLLHTTRLHRASISLSHSLPLRPSLADLMAHRIYITRTTLAARSLGRNLIRIKLNRQLLKRPSAEELVRMGVLPGECWVGSSGKRGGGYMYSGLAPALVEVKRRVERERVKDRLRGWVEEWGRRGSEVVEKRGLEEEQKPDVNVMRMARRFGRGEREMREWERPRWGALRREDRKEREAPTRAKVLGLRRFWERVGREGGVPLQRL